jgi:hypothetical protein
MVFNYIAGLDIIFEGQCIIFYTGDDINLCISLNFI